MEAGFGFVLRCDDRVTADPSKPACLRHFYLPLPPPFSLHQPQKATILLSPSLLQNPDLRDFPRIHDRTTAQLKDVHPRTTLHTA